MNLFDLRFNQVKVIEQPFSCWADVIARAGLFANVGVGLAQRKNITLEARKKSCCIAPYLHSTVGGPQATTMLDESGRAKNL